MNNEVTQGFSAAIQKVADIEARNVELLEEKEAANTEASRLALLADKLTREITEIEAVCSRLTAQRDQAIADRAVYEVLFISFRTQLHAFEVPADALATLPKLRLRGNKRDDGVKAAEQAGKAAVEQSMHSRHDM